MRLHYEVEWRPHRDSNSGYRRERAVSWASRRWGRRRARLAQLLPAVERSELHHLERAGWHGLELIQILHGPARILRPVDRPELPAGAVGEEHAVLLQRPDHGEGGAFESGDIEVRAQPH